MKYLIRNALLVCLFCCSLLNTSLGLAEINITTGTSVIEAAHQKHIFSVDCLHLRLGQYKCAQPDIDPATQQPKGCTRDNLARVPCTLANGLTCKTTNSSVFHRDIPCRFTNGKSWDVALVLSIFLGTFGFDRFYLGYPALGLLKLSTLGFMFLGQLIDIILIATQVVTPADGSSYIINYFGAGLSVLVVNNETYKVPREDW